MIKGNDLDLTNEKQAKKVQKKAMPIVVKFAANDGCCETKEGDVSYKVGDAILTGVEGEQWPIERPKFDASYEAIAPTKNGEDGQYYKKPIQVFALQMNESFHVNVSWSDDRIEGKAGDWLLQYGADDYGIVSQSIFEKTYNILLPSSVEK
jgi:hypothetical protein